MTDYAELVKNLRFCAAVATALDCDGCEWKGGKYSGLKDKDGAFLDCEEQIKLEAAGAIEELEKKMLNWQATADDHWEAYQHWFHKYMDDMPKWIPVTEGLPEETGRYLVCKRWDYGYGTYHSMSVVSFTDNLNKVDNYDFHGKKYKRPGWFDYDSEYGHFETGDDIVAWMPLPEPQKEETE